LTKESSSFDEWNFNDDEGTIAAKQAEDKSKLSFNSKKTSVTMISSPQEKKNPSQTTIKQCYPYHVQSNSTNFQHNAEPSKKKSANQLGIVDPNFSAYVRNHYVNEYQHRGDNKQGIKSVEECKEGGLPPPIWMKRFNEDKNKKRSISAELAIEKKEQIMVKKETLSDEKIFDTITKDMLKKED